MPTAPCKYYLQGYCRFGNSCRFEHADNRDYEQPPGGSRGYSYNPQTHRQGGSFQSQSKFNSNQQTSSLSVTLQLKDVLNNIPRQELIQHVSGDMQMWEQIRMWPLSCCTYWKDGACIPGFDDISPDELRHEAYDSQLKGSAQTYKSKVVHLLEEYGKLRQRFVNMSANDKRIFISFLDEEKRRVYSSRNYDIGAGPIQQTPTPAATAFAPPPEVTKTTPQMLFGKPVQPSNVAQGGLFTSSQSNTGSLPVIQSDGGLFGKPANSAFGSAFPDQTSIFGPPSSFGAPPQAATPAVGNVFGAAVGGSTFGPHPTTTGFNSALFGSSTASSSASNSTTFGSQTPTTATPFTGPHTLFGKPQANSNPFGGDQSGAARFPASGNDDVAAAIRATNTVTMATRDAVYSALADLTPDELGQFQADKFTLGCIPTRPPPKELC